MRSNNRRRAVALLAGAGMAGWVSVAAAGTGGAVAETNSTVITSQHLDYDYPKRIAVFSGEVVVEDPKVKIMADSITATFATNNQPESITATGNVRIEQTNRVAVCSQACYSVRSGLLVLTGKPVVSRGNDVLTGSRITFNRDTDKMECIDAKMIVTPGAGGLDGLMR